MRPDLPDALRRALAAGDPHEVAALVALGANLHYRHANGYDALINAVHNRDVFADPRLIELLQLLISHGVALSGVSSYGESGLRVLSRLGRFDAVRLLVALLTGDIDKATLLRERGADVDAVGRCSHPPLSYAVNSRQLPMLRWLIDQRDHERTGFGIDQPDEFGGTALIEAARIDHVGAIDLLLQAGAAIDHVHNGSTALSEAASRSSATRKRPSRRPISTPRR
ncbi:MULTISPECIES: ankyrin repeat domain-containing protein [unclassified Rhizobacter]|uniref:ankyrin repeat domain-containing protein n=1 Tax=unclassified Rhizobacter TaxID=2640088 RepID=UPI0006F93D63|nr:MULTISPECIES: ankyrin repeat domain-containing protein [unclassified Rhizobacter]KQU74261.1 hypothetical protein ASC88_27455 [Rhizobacter sp. Root29]KQW03278.1 hypothetical protein ASC98_27790 [Rhizobacter sp. Root1238]KRB14023.1 hypothetical protein ASE08_27425 [Rhizobacter sp. Root16D2]